MIPKELQEAAEKITEFTDMAFSEDSPDETYISRARYEALLLAEAIIHSAINQVERRQRIQQIAKKHTPKN